MHIENVNITLSVPGFGAALLSALADAEFAEPAQVGAIAAVPVIGQPWPGIDGVYAGVSRGENGEPDAHLVLLNAKADSNMKWEDAVAWAKGLGDGARLPTRFESALLYAHLQDQFDTDRWHWTGTQYSSGDAWGQDFDDGDQDIHGEKFEARARAVRLIQLNP